MAIILNSKSQTFGNLAIEKLKEESKAYKGTHGVVRDGVLSALKLFCQQSEDFAKVIYESEKSFDSCMKTVLHNHGGCLSDIEAYRRAVCFYFENADVEFEMKILLPEGSEKEKSAVILNLFDLM